MATRRSSRAPSAKPASKLGLDKPVSKPHPNGTSTKRAASPEHQDPPPVKRSRSGSQPSENDPPAPPASRKPRSKIAAKETAAKKPRKLSPVRENAPVQAFNQLQLKPYFNELPTPPQKQRPGLLPFAWGTGNFGQFGMGPDVLEELPKPKRNTWAEEQMEDDAFGEGNGGMEFVAAGGLHTVFIDEKGTVRQSLHL